MRLISLNRSTWLRDNFLEYTLNASKPIFKLKCLMNHTLVAVFLNHLASSCQEAGRERTHRISVSLTLQFFSLKSSRTRSLRYLIIAEITSTASISFPSIAFTFVDLKNGSYNKHRYIYA